MFRTLTGGVVLYPADAVSTENLVKEAIRNHGPVYIRTTRNATPIIYAIDEEFPIGGSKVVKHSPADQLTVAAAGITLHEALAAYEKLKMDGIDIRVIDLYSIRPLDIDTLEKAATQTAGIVTVEDHYPAGGIGEAVATAMAELPTPVYRLAVEKMPKSGTSGELLRFEEISRDAIARKVKEVLGLSMTPTDADHDLDYCTKAPEWAEHQRFDDTDQPCDDGRRGRL
jgi:transketolase